MNRHIDPGTRTAVLADAGTCRDVGARHGISAMTVARLRAEAPPAKRAGPGRPRLDDPSYRTRRKREERAVRQPVGSIDTTNSPKTRSDIDTDADTHTIARDVRPRDQTACKPLTLDGFSTRTDTPRDDTECALCGATMRHAKGTQIRQAGQWFDVCGTCARAL